MPSKATITSKLPWILAGVSVVVLIVAAIWKFDQPSQDQPARNPQPLDSRGTTDISQMSPREAANRLFNRVVSAAERGDSSEVAFFSPMAIQSYEMLGALDNDARYDLGMIYAVNDRLAEAEAQADSIEQSVSDHLLAVVLRAEIAKGRADQESLRRAYRRFLDAVDEERAIDRPEYTAHRRTIEGFELEASEVLGSQR